MNANGDHAIYDLVVKAILFGSLPIAFMNDTTTLVHSKAIQATRCDTRSPTKKTAEMRSGAYI